MGVFVFVVFVFLFFCFFAGSFLKQRRGKTFLQTLVSWVLFICNVIGG